MSRAIKEVAHYLGNTPAVARASYIDPRVFDRFAARPARSARRSPRSATTRTRRRSRARLEEAVLDLLEGVRSSEHLERVT